MTKTNSTPRRPQLTPGTNTPCYYPPWFPSYKAFRKHINALVVRKEAELRAAVSR